MPVVHSVPDSRLHEWTKAQARPAQRQDSRVGAICEAFLGMDCSSRAADCFDGRLKHLPLDRLAVNRVLASMQDVYRTPASIARSQALPFYPIASLTTPGTWRPDGWRVPASGAHAGSVDWGSTAKPLHNPIHCRHP